MISRLSSLIILSSFLIADISVQGAGVVELYSLHDKRPVAIHVDKFLISGFDSSDSTHCVDFFEELQKVDMESASFLDVFSDGTTNTNYMQSSFFVVGDVRGAGTQLPYRTLPLKTDGKRIIWGSARSSWPLDGLANTHAWVPGREGNRHSEPQFAQDMQEVFMAEPTISFMRKKLNDEEDDLSRSLEKISISEQGTSPSQARKVLQLQAIVRETLRTDPTQFAPFLREGGNTKIRCYGFVLDSTFDICSSCLGDLASLVEDKSRCSLSDFMEQQRKDIGEKYWPCQSRSRIIVNAAFPYIGTDYRASLEGETCEYQYNYSNSSGVFAPKSSDSKVTGGVRWEYMEKDLHVPIVCRIRSLFRVPADAQSGESDLKYSSISPNFDDDGTLKIRW